MKRLGYWVSLLATVVISFLGFFGSTQPVVAGGRCLQPTTLLAVETQLLSVVVSERLCTDSGQKIDLNNANLVAFTDCPGFYPTLARLIVEHGPYPNVESVLELPGLSARQKELLMANLDNFTVKAPVVPLERRMPPRPAMRK